MVGFKANRRVLIVGGDGVAIFSHGVSGFDREGSIPWDIPNFDDLLIDMLSKERSRGPVAILYDGADQTYRREENLPKLSVMDRAAYVKRRLEMAFPSYDVRASMELKPAASKKGGRDKPKQSPAFLFVGISDTEHLNRIGDAVLESDVPVAGFGLLPIEAASLMKELSNRIFESRSRWILLAGQQETGGLRQVVIRDNHLALTRTTLITEGGTGGAGWAEEAGRELQATITYISRYGYTQEDSLDVIMICGEVEKQFFDARTIAAKNFKCLNVKSALGVLGINAPQMGNSNFSDALYAAWASKRPSMLLPVKVPTIEQVKLPRYLARAGAMVLALGAAALLALSVQSYWGYSVIEEEISQKQNQQGMLEREYAEEQKVFDGLEIRPAAMRAAMDNKRLLEKNSPDVSDFLQRLKSVLDGNVFMQELEFQHTPSGDINLPSRSLPASRIPLGLGGAAITPGERGMVTAKFRFTLPDTLSLEEKVLRAEKIAEELRRVFRGYRVVVVSQFGKVSAGGKFEGVFGSRVSKDENFAEIQMEGAP
jgi:hypothetical protein